MTTPPAQTSRDLLAAAEVLEQRGWTRHAYEDVHGHCCALGAVVRAIRPALDMADPSYLTDGDEQQRYTLADQHLRAAILEHVDPDVAGPWGETVDWWNDRVARNASDVVGMLRLAAGSPR